MNKKNLQSSLRKISGAITGATAGYLTAGKVAAKAGVAFWPIAVVCIAISTLAGWVIVATMEPARHDDES